MIFWGEYDYLKKVMSRWHKSSLGAKLTLLPHQSLQPPHSLLLISIAEKNVETRSSSDTAVLLLLTENTLDWAWTEGTIRLA